MQALLRQNGYIRPHVPLSSTLVHDVATGVVMHDVATGLVNNLPQALESEKSHRSLNPENTILKSTLPHRALVERGGGSVLLERMERQVLMVHQVS